VIANISTGLAFVNIANTTAKRNETPNIATSRHVQLRMKYKNYYGDGREWVPYTDNLYCSKEVLIIINDELLIRI
jgi:hypothetical protein